MPLQMKKLNDNGAGVFNVPETKRCPQVVEDDDVSLEQGRRDVRGERPVAGSICKSRAAFGDELPSRDVGPLREDMYC